MSRTPLSAAMDGDLRQRSGARRGADGGVVVDGDIAARVDADGVVGERRERGRRGAGAVEVEARAVAGAVPAARLQLDGAAGVRARGVDGEEAVGVAAHVEVVLRAGEVPDGADGDRGRGAGAERAA